MLARTLTSRQLMKRDKIGVCPKSAAKKLAKRISDTQFQYDTLISQKALAVRLAPIKAQLEELHRKIAPLFTKPADDEG
jgi:hypothetical protein